MAPRLKGPAWLTIRAEHGYEHYLDEHAEPLQERFNLVLALEPDNAELRQNEVRFLFELAGSRETPPVQALGLKYVRRVPESVFPAVRTPGLMIKEVEERLGWGARIGYEIQDWLSFWLEMDVDAVTQERTDSKLLIEELLTTVQFLLLNNERLLELIDERDQTIDQLRAQMQTLQIELARAEVSRDRVTQPVGWIRKLAAALAVGAVGGIAQAGTMAVLQPAPIVVVHPDRASGDELARLEADMREILGRCDRVLDSVGEAPPS